MSYSIMYLMVDNFLVLVAQLKTLGEGGKGWGALLCSYAQRVLLGSHCENIP